MRVFVLLMGTMFLISSFDLAHATKGSQRRQARRKDRREIREIRREKRKERRGGNTDPVESGSATTETLTQ